MKITSIYVENVMGARSVDLQITAPVLMVAGDNHQGKSSMAEAIRQAFLDLPTRVDKKKEYDQLVTDGAKSGSAMIQWEGGHAAVRLPSGEQEIKFEGITTDAAELMQIALPYVLDPPKFAAIPDDERRKFLYKLMKVKISPKVVAELLQERECDMEKAKSVIPLLVSGFPAACEEATSKARECKGSWKATTGEAYGTVKAESWTAQIPEVQTNDDDLRKAQNELSNIEAELEKATMQLGGLTGQANSAQKRSERLSVLLTVANTLESAREALAADEKAHAAMLTQVEEVRAKASGTSHIDPYICPHCENKVDWVKGELVKHVPPKNVSDPEAKTKLPLLEKTLKTLATTLKSSQQAVADAEQATQALKAEKEDIAAPSAEEIAKTKTAVDDLKTKRQQCSALIESLQEASRAIDVAKKKTEDAARYHADVLSWLKIADALSPDGIPTDLLSKALDPFNAHLAQAAELAQWPAVVIGKDMRVTYGGRSYRLRSESEKWRADAMIAEAIASLSGIRFVCFDRFDCLNSAGRVDLIEWLSVATSSTIDSAIIFGTMKERQKNMPPEVQPIWMEDGIAQQVPRIEERIAA